MRELYPPIEAFASHTLDSNSGHQIYFEEAGNATGIPVIFLHGGPGSGCNENHRRYFNPEKFRIVLLDQRGCNRSTPNGHVNDNTTQDLIIDIESIRKKLNIDKWLLFGGSWGATLALLYAEQYPDYVTGLILRGSFLARQKDFDWFAEHGVNKIMPDYWSELTKLYPFDTSSELVTSIHKDVFSEEKQTALKAAKAWSLWAGRVVTNCFDMEYAPEFDDGNKLINEVRIEMHYAKHKYFINENQIINNIDCIPEVPVTIIHGRQDLTCLAESSWLLHQAISGSELHMIKNTGHLAGETRMINALIEATDKMAKTLL
ncbi:MAG: prolyl aminopeptidase [Pseudomonadota bacterium]